MPYLIHRLRIRSEIDLQGARAFDGADFDLEVFCAESRSIPSIAAAGQVLADVSFGNGQGYSLT